jgi:hypothetical protein
MKSLLSVITAAAFIAAGALSNGCRFEQSSLNPATQVCDDTGPRPSCTEVTHVH